MIIFMIANSYQHNLWLFPDEVQVCWGPAIIILHLCSTYYCLRSRPVDPDVVRVCVRDNVENDDLNDPNDKNQMIQMIK